MLALLIMLIVLGIFFIVISFSSFEGDEGLFGGVFLILALVCFGLSYAHVYNFPRTVKVDKPLEYRMQITSDGVTYDTVYLYRVYEEN